MALCHGGAKNNRKRSCEFCHVNYVSAYTRSRTNTLSSRREPRRARSRPLDPGRTFWRQRAHSLGLFREVRPDGGHCSRPGLTISLLLFRVLTVVPLLLLTNKNNVQALTFGNSIQKFCVPSAKKSSVEQASAAVQTEQTTHSSSSLNHALPLTFVRPTVAAHFSVTAAAAAINVTSS